MISFFIYLACMIVGIYSLRLTFKYPNTFLYNYPTGFFIAAGWMSLAKHICDYFSI
jgi:hypothetical protein